MARHLKVEKTRKVYTYSELWRTSYWTLNQAENEPAGSYFQIMASLLFTAFTLEAYLNHIGQDMFKCWNDLERLSPEAKMKLISEKLGMKNDTGSNQFQMIKKLYSFRNDLAHGKTKILKASEEITVVDLDEDSYMHKPLEMEWEQFCTLDNAKEARKNVELTIRSIHEIAAIKDDHIFFLGSTNTHAELKD
jgi:hypothetical protein